MIEMINICDGIHKQMNIEIDKSIKNYRVICIGNSKKQSNFYPTNIFPKQLVLNYLLLNVKNKLEVFIFVI